MAKRPTRTAPDSPLVELCKIRDDLADRLRAVSEAIALLVNPSPEAALLTARLTLETERRRRSLERGKKPQNGNAKKKT
jgi:hypothetical protein